MPGNRKSDAAMLIAGAYVIIRRTLESPRPRHAVASWNFAPRTDLENQAAAAQESSFTTRGAADLMVRGRPPERLA